MARGKWPTCGWFCVLHCRCDENTAVFYKTILVVVYKRGWKAEGQLEDEKEDNFSPMAAHC